MIKKILPLALSVACIPARILACEPPPFSPAPPSSRPDIDQALFELSASNGVERVGRAQKLSRQLVAQGRPQEAIALLKAERDRAGFSGSDQRQVAFLEVDLAIALLRAGASDEAEATASRAAGILGTAAYGATTHIAALLALARSENARAMSQEATAHLETASQLALRGGYKLLLAQIREVQGNQLLVRGDGVNARKAYEEALSLFEQGGTSESRLHSPMVGLANAEFLSGDFERANVSFDRAVAAAARSWGSGSIQVARVRIEQARLLTATGDFAEAACNAQQARDSLAADKDYDRGLASSALGFAEMGRGDLNAAFESFREAASAITRARGDGSPDLPPSLMQLAKISMKRDAPQVAENYGRTAQAILERQDPGSPQLAEAISLRAEALLAMGDGRQALALATRARDIIRARGTSLERFTTSLAPALSEQVSNRLIYERYLDIAYQVGGKAAMTRDEAFVTAQNLHRGKTSSALLRHLAQSAEMSPQLRPLLDQRAEVSAQLADAIAREDEAYLSGPANAPPNRLDLSGRRRELSARLDDLDQQIGAAAPDFASARSDLVSAAELRKALRPGEAFLMQATTERATHLWLVKADDPDLHYARTDVAGAALRRLVQALRASLGYKQDGLAPPFDASSAFHIHQAVLHPFAGQLADVRTLVYSLDRQAEALPLAILVATDPAGQTEPDRLDFLVRHHIATAMVPSPGSLVALRQPRAVRIAPLPFLGIGAPILQGSATTQASAMRRLMARMRVAIDPSDIRALEPISNGAQQLETMAANFEKPPADLLPGEKATETRLHATALDQYKVMAFVTHGLVAGQFSHLAEPGLVMTPPDAPSPTDDGLLTASEVARLKLNADLVILSACDTAAGDGSFNADGLSGLSRAFFAAGARALMVSGWPIKPQAATRLTSEVLRTLSAPDPPGKAEALRAAMETMLIGQVSVLKEPSMWGSLFIVGDP
ncbi:CHAT domain-containing tetratricopeptide repeat protein [Sphingobium sp.]|uniref:CHAT domain-containing tetratricopeptide repeat protein n=1 Tax=Sphingobium sp. TaxID=1912891 RepID=UPI002C5172B4|nr:CHAT domain-containing protein [Sphingobium sp.]HUD93871.1 CHAT domain-containing protein [Sphingobium sp.]